jgi:hypothetical protein
MNNFHNLQTNFQSILISIWSTHLKIDISSWDLIFPRRQCCNYRCRYVIDGLQEKGFNQCKFIFGSILANLYICKVDFFSRQFFFLFWKRRGLSSLLGFF